MADNKNSGEVRSTLFWAKRYVDCLTEEANGVELDAADRAFVDAVEAIAEAVPGALEDVLLSYGLTRGPAEAGSTGVAAQSPRGAKSRGAGYIEPRRLAAATRDSGATVADLLAQARASGSDAVMLNPEWGEGPLLRILTGESVVEVCYLENMTVMVERQDGTTQVVGPFGGVFLSPSESEHLRVSYSVHEGKPALLLKRD
jgi:hypothetical protein